MAGWIAYALLVVPLTFLVVTKRMFSPAPLAVAFLVAGLALVVWARLAFGWRSLHAGSDATKGGLVTSGPYRWVRHPIYAGVMLALAGVVIGHHDASTIVAVAIIVAALGVRIAAEERSVVRMYPEYASYARRTKRLVPWLF
jgi:protein-S-isoprenylcysteine O-methyltransferase Ste14